MYLQIESVKRSRFQSFRLGIFHPTANEFVCTVGANSEADFSRSCCTNMQSDESQFARWEMSLGSRESCRGIASERVEGRSAERRASNKLPAKNHPFTYTQCSAVYEQSGYPMAYDYRPP